MKPQMPDTKCAKSLIYNKKIESKLSKDVKDIKDLDLIFS
jgi:hypothetical protein